MIRPISSSQTDHNIQQPSLPASLLDVVLSWQFLPVHIQETVLTLVELRKTPVALQNLEPAYQTVGSVLQTLKDLQDLQYQLLRALRHCPSDCGFSMNSDGWVQKVQVCIWLQNQRPTFRYIGLDNLLHGMQDRIQVRGGFIRASYGHSCPEFAPATSSIPLQPLFHGTSSTNLELIEIFGLLPSRRRFVQLTTDFNYAQQIAKKCSKKPVVLQIITKQALNDGVQFFETGTHVWLSTPIPGHHVHPWQVFESDQGTVNIDFDETDVQDDLL